MNVLTEREYAAADLERVAREIKAIAEDRAESLRSAEIADLLFAASTIAGVAFRDDLAAPRRDLARRPVLRATPVAGSTIPEPLTVERLSDAMSDAYEYTGDTADFGTEPVLPFVDDHQGFWRPFAAKVLALLGGSTIPDRPLDVGSEAGQELLADIAVMALGEVTTGAAYGLYHKSFREHFVARLTRVDRG